jgi:hypothetical protein
LCRLEIDRALGGNTLTVNTSGVNSEVQRLVICFSVSVRF